MRTLFLLPLILLLTDDFACGNEYGYSLDGERRYTQYFYLSERMKSFNEDYLKENLDKLQQELDANPDNFKKWSNVALNLMKLGQADSAVKILDPLVKEHPHEYNLIANLGTAYELTGQLDSALKYISYGYEVNPQSHDNSEWIHVAILKAKLKEEAQPGWLSYHAIIELGDLEERMGEGRYAARDISRNFFYQLRTRAPFTPAPNKVMANLMETLGDFNEKHGTYENALLAYMHALQYQKYWEVEHRLKRKIKAMNQKRKANDKIKELPHEFVRLIKLGELDPTLVVMGLDDFTAKMDSTDRSRWAKQDSLELLKAQLYSLQHAGHDHEEEAVAMNFTTNNGTGYGWLFALAGIALGMGITWVVLRRRG